MHSKGKVAAIAAGLLIGGGSLLVSLVPSTAAIGDAIRSGDILVGLASGHVQKFDRNGALTLQMSGLNTGPAHGIGLDAALNMYVPHWYSDDRLSGNTVEKYDGTGSMLGVFGPGYDCNPKSIVFDAAGNAYVGQADCSMDVLKLDAAGNLLASYDVAVEERGSDWIDLGPDGCTLYYTSQGLNVKRFNVCTNKQMADFNRDLLPDQVEGAHGLRVLPGGGVLVANFHVIARLDAQGDLVQTYDSGFENCWTSVDLDVDGVSFWASDFCSSNVYEFDLSTGEVLFTFSTNSPPFTVKGVKVPPGVPAEAGRMTGGGSVFTANGTRVTHGFELHCDASDPPNNLEINWEGNRFHLERLESASCTDDPAIHPHPPTAPFDTYRGTGTGRHNGATGASAEWTFTDAGEPGKRDTAMIVIRDATGAVVLTVDTRELTFGNHQAHRR